MILFNENFRTVQCNCWSPTQRLKEYNEFNIDVQVISPIPIMFSYWADPKDALEVSRFINDFIASVCSENPKKFIGLGTVPMQSTKEAIKELERCKNELNLPGIEIGSNINDQNLNEDDNDYYDENERGGNGIIDAADVIVSLLTASNIPGFEYINRSDIDNPYSTRPDEIDRDNDAELTNDVIVFAGDDDIYAGDYVSIPVRLDRGNVEGLTAFAIGAMFVLSRSLVKTGFLVVFADFMYKWEGRWKWLSIFVFLLIVSILSGLINNTAVVAIFIPFVIAWNWLKSLFTGGKDRV